MTDVNENQEAQDYIELDEETYNKALVIAEERGITVEELIHEMLIEALENNVFETNAE